MDWRKGRDLRVSCQLRGTTSCDISGDVHTTMDPGDVKGLVVFGPSYALTRIYLLRHTEGHERNDPARPGGAAPSSDRRTLARRASLGRRDHRAPWAPPASGFE